MEALGLSQQVRTSTDKQGNILDLIYIQDNSQLKFRNCQTHAFISGHAIVTIVMYLLMEKPKCTTKKICNNKKVTKEALIQNFEPPTTDEHTGQSQAYNQLKTKLQELLGKTTSEKQSGFMISPNNHTLTSSYDSKGKLLKRGRGLGENSRRITTRQLIKKKQVQQTTQIS